MRIKQIITVFALAATLSAVQAESTAKGAAPKAAATANQSTVDLVISGMT